MCIHILIFPFMLLDDIHINTQMLMCIMIHLNLCSFSASRPAPFRWQFRSFLRLAGLPHGSVSQLRKDGPGALMVEIGHEGNTIERNFVIGFSKTNGGT